jgi:hypothetical protein
VVVTALGLSDEAPLCCPDIMVRRVYQYDAGTFTLVDSSTTPATSPS